MTRLNYFLRLILLIATWTLTPPSALVNAGEHNPDTKGRWYLEDQVTSGKSIFKRFCSECHGGRAQGALNWKTKLSNGSYPPPPLNGTGHTWHHDMNLLLKTINDGGRSFGGKMPSFKDTLSEGEKKSVIAYIQSYWSERIYDIWAKNSGFRKTPGAKLGESLKQLIEPTRRP